MKTIRTLCSGGELFGVGARQAGYRHLDGYEINPKIAAVARLNGFDVRAADVCQVAYDTLPPADHLHISPSCKNASPANRDGGETDDDRAVADACVRAIRAHQGATFTLENVWMYRTFESFGRIRAALTEAGFSYEFWHLNAADYGVPQTRKRLILIARRGLCRITRPHPTHRKNGDMFSPRWVGWYAAIADILHTLPPTKPAPWQEARMPKAIRESTLVAQRAYEDQLLTVNSACPAFTITANRNQSHIRAYLLDSENTQSGTTRADCDPVFTISNGGGTYPRAYLIGNNNQEWGDGVVTENEPSFSVTTQSHGRARAYIVGGDNTQLSQVDSHARPDDAPMFTIRASDGAKKTAAAYLLDGDNARCQTGEPTLRADDEPAMTMRGTRTPAHRAIISGRWVRMTIQALGRFQTVPDDYIGLTAEINGNGVPCLLARRIMEHVRD